MRDFVTNCKVFPASAFLMFVFSFAYLPWWGRGYRKLPFLDAWKIRFWSLKTYLSTCRQLISFHSTLFSFSTGYFLDICTLLSSLSFQVIVWKSAYPSHYSLALAFFQNPAIQSIRLAPAGVFDLRASVWLLRSLCWLVVLLDAPIKSSQICQIWKCCWILSDYSTSDFCLLAPVCQPYFTGYNLRSFNGIPVRHHEHLLARHWFRLPVSGLLPPLYGLMASRYRRG